MGPGKVQWLRICPAMQGTQVLALLQEDPTCLGTTKPVATATEPRESRHCNERSCMLQPRPDAAKLINLNVGVPWVQSDWCPYKKKKFGRMRDTREEHTAERLCEEDGHLQAKEKDLRRNQLCPHLHAGPLVSRTVRLYSSVVKGTWSAMFCCDSPS